MDLLFLFIYILLYNNNNKGVENCGKVENIPDLSRYPCIFPYGKHVEEMWKDAENYCMPSLDSICRTAVLNALSFFISFFAFSKEDMIVE